MLKLTNAAAGFSSVAAFAVIYLRKSEELFETGNQLA